MSVRQLRLQQQDPDVAHSGVVCTQSNAGGASDDWATMDVVDEFIARYIKEYDFYDQAARLAMQLLESSLKSAGVRCIVTARAKSLSRLEDKCRKRCEERAYASVDDIFADIVDLAGVRVALYFPGEEEHVDRAIGRLFTLLEGKKSFPEEKKDRSSKRFSGYRASHYRVRLRDDQLGEAEKRYAEAKIEIQVASVLMHAWSEVEHDLVYKPLAGDLSDGELAILDQLNGLVIAGEMALEQLQKAGEARVAEQDRPFQNHYDLAVHLIGLARTLHEEPIVEEGLGRVDRLFWLIHRLELDTPQKLAPYLEALHGNFDQRPLADQVIDALLAEDPGRYDVLSALRDDGRRHDNQDQDDQMRALGSFITSWIELEVLVRELARHEGGDDRIRVMTQYLDRLTYLDANIRREIDLLRYARNNVMHGVDIPPASFLTEAAGRVRAIIELLKGMPNAGGQVHA